MRRIHCIILSKVGLILLVIMCHVASAQPSYTTFQPAASAFPLSRAGKSSAIYVNDQDYPGVLRAARDLQKDIMAVTEAQPEMMDDDQSPKPEMIVIGTIGKGGLIDQFIQNKKLDVSDIRGKWETFVIQVVENPLPNVKHALVIAGSDKRGTIFGIYDVSQQIGVSPWYWWADVPAKKHKNVYVLPGRYVQGEPEVKYRGIFINDEEPALGRWVVKNYGGFNHQFYEKVFELLLRHKANYLWPAMWWASFSSDDSLNARTADMYGVVIGTTHHEPMMRAHAEWKTFGKGGAWNYETNAEQLRKFWTEGIQRMNGYESIISLGMRGDGDMAMTAETNVALLQRIVADQRTIISEVTGKPNASSPQLWALYKEVQDYYDKGMSVPDDVTLLLCDDNWGNIRKLPRPGDKPRSGGYGIYYHFDYVGGPRNYKWINTNPLPRVWEQMNLANQHGANRIWIVNVGDIKPLELPTAFFLDYAWNPKQWHAGNIHDYTEQWSALQFGKDHAKEIARLLEQYAKFNGRRKPELLSPDVYSLLHYDEADRVVQEYNALAAAAERINAQLPEDYKDAFYQLVLYPIKASANLHELWVTTGKNHLYASQRRSSTNDMAIRVKELFKNDSAWRVEYNTRMANGKWDHMMDQTHISYTYWQQPAKDVLPELKLFTPDADPSLHVVAEGSSQASGKDRSELPVFVRGGTPQYYFDLFNSGRGAVSYRIKCKAPWIVVTQREGTFEKEQRIFVRINWSKVTSASDASLLEITGSDGTSVSLGVKVKSISLRGLNGVFLDNGGYISIEAAHFTKAVDADNITWKVIPDLGRTGSAVMVEPVTASAPELTKHSPHLQYNIALYDTGMVTMYAMFSPTLNYHNTGGRRYAISIDDEPPQVINLHDDKSPKAWDRWVSDNIITKMSSHKISAGGNHTVKFWMVDAGVVLQKIVIDTGGLKASYLGPPETYYLPSENK